MPLIADLHCHTVWSHDSCNRIQWIINRCNKVGINCLAVTDHDCIDGAFQLKEAAPFRVIVGEEINTGEGEIIGLFINSWISPMQGLAKTIENIKMQDALVYLPHPLSISRNTSLNLNKLKELHDEIDIVEVFNSRTRHEHDDDKWFIEWINTGKVVKAVGSDAHAPYEFGNVMIKMENFTSKEEFLQSLAGAYWEVKKSSIFFRYIFNHKIRKIIRHFL
ncbi:MAG: PHP domain-containing protein [Bacteroidales bacterium]|nr:PHP domain-containing protein [Bacteroidales bacterium]